MAFIHQHRRKRVHQNLQPYPHQKAYYRAIDAIVTVVAVIAPFASIPQLLEIWVNHQTDGVSLFTWSLFLIFTLPLLLYAITHKDLRLITMYSLYAFFNAATVMGILLFS